MSKLQNYVFFASNDGGHFAQMLVLQDLFKKYETVIVTDNIRANKGIPALSEVKSIEYAMSFANRRNELKERQINNLTIWNYLPAFWGLFKECNSIWKKYRPRVIVSTGSNIAVPLAYIAKVHGTKMVYIETRAKVYNKTITGKLIGWICDKVIVQWPEMVQVYKGKAEYYGTLI